MIVTGSIFERKIETVEKRKSAKENKTLRLDETAKDENIVDIYTEMTQRFSNFEKGLRFFLFGNEK